MADQTNDMDQVSIDLNLEPPVPRLATSARIALELGLGVQESEGFTDVIRQNFPRFDPRTAELLPISFREEEAFPSVAQDVTSTVNMHPEGHNDSLDSSPMPGVEVNDFPSVSHANTANPGARTSWTPYQPQAHRPRRRLLRWPGIVRFLNEEELQTSSNVVFPEGAHLASDFGRQFLATFASSIDGQGTEAGPGPGTPRIGTRSETGNVDLLVPDNAILKSDNAGCDLPASYFECNICLETAKEPIVSCCGHLFCWPCIYKWLHVYSLEKECPVCKGALPDNSLTPIYGRGCALDSDKSPGIIPPRPKAQRLSGRKERNAWNVLARNFIMTVGSEMGTESMNIQGLNNNAIRAGYRVMRRSQLEQQERLLLRQRLMGRREVALMLHAAMLGDDAMSTHGNIAMNQRLRQSLETATDGLAIVQASLDGLDATMQGLFETTRTQGTSSGEVQEELIEPSSRSLTGHNRFVGGASGSGDVDPGLMHCRKRRRLN